MFLLFGHLTLDIRLEQQRTLKASFFKEIKAPLAQTVQLTPVFL